MELDPSRLLSGLLTRLVMTKVDVEHVANYKSHTSQTRRDLEKDSVMNPRKSSDFTFCRCLCAGNIS